MIERRELLGLLAGAATFADFGIAIGQGSAKARHHHPAPDGKSVPPFVKRGLPGPFHAALDPLVGEWGVDKEIYIAIGSPEKPAKSSGMTAKRRWFGGGKHLEDITQGTIGGAYYRLGVLGFSNLDARYEWVTFDALNANLMLYRGVRLDKPSQTIVMTGTFTDQGLLGEDSVGKEIPMRTLIEIESHDRHAISLFFTPPGRGEILIDKSVYTRA
jgi:hypothetical protein